MQMPEIEASSAVVRTDNPLLGHPRQATVCRCHWDTAGDRKLKQRSTGIPGTRAVFVTQMALFRQRGQLLGGTT